MTLDVGCVPPTDGLGAMLPCGPVPAARWHEAPAAFAELEAAGCSALWVTDHLFWGVDVPEALTMAAVAAAATTRCAIGTGVLQLPLRSIPAVAKAATTIQAVSGGRFLLGVGSGEHAVEYGLVGADFTRRGALLDRGLAELRELWGPGDGRYEQRPAPAPIPIWVGGRGAASLARAAAVGDGWLPIFVTPAQVAAGVRDLDERLDQLQRARSAVRREAVVLVAVTGRGTSRADALAWAGKLWGMDPSRLDRYLVAGAPEQVVDALGAYLDAGADRITVLPATDDPVPMLTRLVPSFDPAPSPVMVTAP